MKEPLVIINCLVYNHEPYLRQCLDGFVMQQTTFPFYAVVHDDASTDQSAAIIREYASKYPAIIHPIYETENQFSKHDDSLVKIMRAACSPARYIAMCEGDDYWTDPLKLQKQVAFLESHPDYSFVGSKCRLLRGTALEEEDYPIGSPIAIEGDFALFGDVFESYAIYGPPTRTNTLVYRASVVTDIASVGDYLLEAILASKGKFARLETYSSVYRIHSSGMANIRTKSGRLRYALWYAEQRKELNRLFPSVCHFDEDEIQDGVVYEELKIAVEECDYKTAWRARNALRSALYKHKTYARYLKGPCTFALLCLTTKLKKL